MGYSRNGIGSIWLTVGKSEHCNKPSVSIEDAKFEEVSAYQSIHCSMELVELTFVINMLLYIGVTLGTSGAS